MCLGLIQEMKRTVFKTIPEITARGFQSPPFQMAEDFHLQIITMAMLTETLLSVKELRPVMDTSRILTRDFVPVATLRIPEAARTALDTANFRRQKVRTKRLERKGSRSGPISIN